MNWNSLTSIQQFDQLLEDRSNSNFLVLKHSTRCSISSMAKNRLESKLPDILDPSAVFIVDLIQYRSLSNHIADQLSISHESPQAFLINNGSVIWSASHNAISVKAIKDYL